MGTKDTAAVSSATAMRVLDATRRAYRRGPWHYGLSGRAPLTGTEVRGALPTGFGAGTGRRLRGLCSLTAIGAKATLQERLHIGAQE
jgi:hypothetical protein